MRKINGVLNDVHFLIECRSDVHGGIGMISALG